MRQGPGTSSHGQNVGWKHGLILSPRARGAVLLPDLLWSACVCGPGDTACRHHSRDGLATLDKP